MQNLNSNKLIMDDGKMQLIYINLSRNESYYFIFQQIWSAMCELNSQYILIKQIFIHNLLHKVFFAFNNTGFKYQL